MPRRTSCGGPGSAALLRRSTRSTPEDPSRRPSPRSSTTTRSTLTAYETALAAKNYNLATVKGVQQWFMDRMAFSPRPLEEKMTYFWNLHWTSGISKVKGVTLILNQNKTERQYAMGKFDDLVVSISQDPAMLVWLDNWLYTADATQRELRARADGALHARRIEQLHADGRDRASRARFPAGRSRTTRRRTTTTAPPSSTTPRFTTTGRRPSWDRRGNWNGYDAINIILNWTRRATAPSPGRFLGAKLWTFFALPGPARLRRRRSSRRSTSPRAARSAKSCARSSSRPSSTSLTPRKTWVRSPVEYAVGVGPDAGRHDRFLVSRPTP